MTKKDTVDSNSDHRDQMKKAVEIAARKVKKEPKAETGQEMFLRIRQESETKKNKGIKKAAKSMVKKKTIKKMTGYFSKK